MIAPIRCFNCGKVVSNKFETFHKLKKSKSSEWIFKHLKIDKYCCKMVLLTSIQSCDNILQSRYKLPPNIKRIPSIKKREFVAR